jgi:HEPN domain-containing protein
MRQPEEVRLDLTAQWLSKGEKDFALARHLVEERAPYWEAIGFHCQQAVEKYLKAFLTWHGIEFPKTHNLGELRLLAAGLDATLMDDLRDVTELNPYGVETRYPGDMPEMLPGAAADAFSVTEVARAAILTRLRALGAPIGDSAISG